MSLVRFRPEAPLFKYPLESKEFDFDGRHYGFQEETDDAGVAHPVERHLAKVEVASSSLVTRSKNKERLAFLISYGTVAKW